MIADIRALFCKWTPLEAQMLGCLSNSLAPQYQAVLEAQINAVTKIQRILGWVEIDLYAMRRGRVCWDHVPCFDDTGEFRLARVHTVVGAVAITSELHCVSGHLFSIESDLPLKPYAFRQDARVKIQETDPRYGSVIL